MSDVLPDNCGWGATREPMHCRGAISKSGFPTIQASSCAQHPSNALKTSWYNCLLTIWPRGTNSWRTIPVQSKNTTNITLIFDRLIRALFWSRRPFPHPLRRLHLGFNIIPTNPRLISCYDVLKKVSITICIGKQFLTDFSTALFLIVCRQTRHEFCTDATYLTFFRKN